MLPVPGGACAAATRLTPAVVLDYSATDAGRGYCRVAEAVLQKLYVRDEDWEIYLGRRLHIIRGTEEVTGTLKSRDETYRR